MEDRTISYKTKQTKCRQKDKNRSAKYRQLAGSPPQMPAHADKQFSHMHRSKFTKPPVAWFSTRDLFWLNVNEYRDRMGILTEIFQQYSQNG